MAYLTYWCRHRLVWDNLRWRDSVKPSSGQVLGLGKQYLALMFHLSQATSTFHQNLKTARLWNLGIALPFPHNWAPIRLFENAQAPTILENRKSTLNAEVCIIQCFPHNTPLISFCKVLTQNKWKWQWLLQVPLAVRDLYMMLQWSWGFQLQRFKYHFIFVQASS